MSGQPADQIDHPYRRLRRVERIDGEVPTLGIGLQSRPNAPTMARRPSVSMPAQRGASKDRVAGDHGDRAVLDARRHRLKPAASARLTDCLVGPGRRNVDVLTA